MFGIPDAHISQLIKSEKYPDAILSLIEECNELSMSLSKHRQEHYESWDSSRSHIIEEMTHVLVSINLVAGQLNITPYDIHQEIRRKALIDGFDMRNY